MVLMKFNFLFPFNSYDKDVCVSVCTFWRKLKMEKKFHVNISNCLVVNEKKKHGEWSTNTHVQVIKFSNFPRTHTHKWRPRKHKKKISFYWWMRNKCIEFGPLGFLWKKMVLNGLANLSLTNHFLSAFSLLSAKFMIKKRINKVEIAITRRNSVCMIKIENKNHSMIMIMSAV